MKSPILIRLFCAVFVAGLSVAAPFQTHAQGEPPARQLVIGTKSAPPFVIKTADGNWKGISIELWRDIAAKLNLTYRFREATLEELIDGVAAGSLDGSVAALTITPDREAKIDFSHPFYSTGLAIAVPVRKEGGWFDVAKRFFSLDFLSVLAGLIVVLFGAGFLVWLFERHRNPDQFGGSVAQGLGSGFWWSAVTMTTVGYGDKSPVTAAGRAVALVWMFVAIIVISSFTASITSSLTVNRLEGAIKGLNDLRNVRTATVAGSTSRSFLAAQSISFRETPTIESALQDLSSGKIDAIVYDAPVLKYLVKQGYAGELYVLPETLGRQDYGIALPGGSPLRETINRELLRKLDTPEWSRLLDGYIGR